MGKGKIDLGISTEEKPEWTISLDFVANNMVKDDLAEQSNEQEKPKGSRSIFNDALDSDFLSDDRSSFSDTQMMGGGVTGIDGGLDETIQSPGVGSSFGNDGNNDSMLGAVNGAMLGGAEDSLTTISTGADTSFENEVFIDPLAQNGEKKESASSIDYPEQSLKETEPESVWELDHTSQIPEEEEDLSGIIEQPAVESFSGIINELEQESQEGERDVVEEKLAHLANSIDPWEQSENALSEAAAMLSKEGKAAGGDSEEKKLKDLFERLDISENLDRMNAVALEDMADVIEQTQKDNELVDAIDVGTVESVDTVMGEPDPVLDLEPQREEAVLPGEMEITNDMFDMGYDLSDEEENYSDENIDLDSFNGSLEDAEEFSSAGNSLDLDEQTGQNTAELDMSNLVEAAMSGLSVSYENENILDFAMPEEESMPEPEESTLSETGFVTGPEENENILDFAMPEEESMSEPEESTLAETEFITGPEENENILDFAMPEEESMPKPEESTLSETGFVTGPEGDVLQSLSAEFQLGSAAQEDGPVEVETEPEELKLEFEPVYPEGQGPNFAGILNDTGDGDVASMIIEDYSEVPTVSDIETKLKKREKEKKKIKSKENHHKKTDGFAYSLDDITPHTEEHVEQAAERTLVGREAVEAALEVAAETAAAKGGVSGGEEFPSREFTASVYARHVVHKEGKAKRSYYSLFYK